LMVPSCAQALTPTPVPRQVVARTAAIRSQDDFIIPLLLVH